MFKNVLACVLCFPAAALAQESTSSLARMQTSTQAGDFYEKLSESRREELVRHLAGDLVKVKNPQVRRTLVSFFYRANPKYGARLAKAVGLDLADTRAMVYGRD